MISNWKLSLHTNLSASLHFQAIVEVLQRQKEDKYIFKPNCSRPPEPNNGTSASWRYGWNMISLTGRQSVWCKTWWPALIWKRWDLFTWHYIRGQNPTSAEHYLNKCNTRSARESIQISKGIHSSFKLGIMFLPHFSQLSGNISIIQDSYLHIVCCWQ